MGVILGTDGDDNLNGSAAGDTIIAGKGADSITGGASNDTVIIEAGQGTGSGFADTVDGGSGNDTLVLAGDIADFDVTFGAGTVILTGKAGTAAEGFAETLTSVESIVFDTGIMRIVDPAGGTGAYGTIQEAVDLSQSGDVVVVTAGTYTESVTVSEAITLIGDAGNVTIDAPSGAGVTVSGDIDAAAGGSGTVTIDGFTFTGNSQGVRDSNGTVLENLVVKNSNFNNNTTAGLGIYDDGVANVTVEGSAFEDNGVGNANSGSIVLFEFTGNATISDTTINSTQAAASSSGYAIQVAGFEQSTYDVVAPLGDVTLDNVDITGEYQKPPLMMQGFWDLSGFSATDVTITGETKWATGDFSALVFIDPVGSNGADSEGSAGYPGHLPQNGGTSTLDLSGITVNHANPSVPADVVVRGLDDHDIITGTNGNDALNIPAEDNNDYGGDDVVMGLGGNDTIVGGEGDDEADGGDDDDTFVLFGTRADYTIVQNADGSYTVTDDNTGDGVDEGTDQLTGIERILFGDSSEIELDANSPSYTGAYTRFAENFEDGDAHDTFADGSNGWQGAITERTNGDDAFSAAEGTQYAIFEQTGVEGSETGPFTSLGGYRAYWEGDYEVEIKIYLDPTAWDPGEGFDVSVAATNAATGAHLRDFVFHTTQDTSSTALLVGASNNTNFEPREDLDTLNHATIDTAGWYTYNWEFYENADGDLEVAMNIYDAAGNWVFTEVRSNPADDIGTVAGSDRYMWFTNIDVDGGIAVDDLSLMTLNTDPVERADGTGVFQDTYATIADAVADASAGDTILTTAGDYSGESPVAVDVEDLTFTGPAGATGIDLELAAGIADVTLAGDAPTDVTGNGEANTIVGNAAGNTISGAAGDDTVTGGEGDDAIDGGDDTDTAVYSNALADYTLATTPDANGRVVSIDSVEYVGAGGTDDGLDTLTSVEVVAFADATLDLTAPIQLFSGGALVGTFDNLEAAVAAAASGDTINLAAGDIAVEDPGTADGQVVIDKDIDIVGAGKAVTRLLAQADTGTAGNDRAMILVNDGATLDLSDLEINGNNKLVFTGIAYNGSGVIDNVAFNEIKYNESGPHYAGIAVGVYGPTSDVDVSNSTFTEIGRIGLHYRGTVTGDFVDNTYTGKGAGDHLDYALDISAGANILVEGNTISNNIGVADVDGSTSAGFLVTTFFAPGTTATVRDNTFTDNTTGVAIGYDGNDASDVTFEGTNAFTGGVTGVNVTGDPTVTDVDTISGTGATVSWDGGPLATTAEGAALADDLAGNDGADLFTGNGGNDTIEGGTGIDTAVYAGNLADFAIDVIAGTITDTNAGDGDEGSDTISGIEVAQFADGNVLFAGSDGYPTIQAAVAAASAGDTIYVLPGNYSGEVDVDKQLTILGAQAGVAAEGRPGTNEAVLEGAFHFTPGSDGSIVDGFTVTTGVSILSALTTAYVQDANITLRNTLFDRDNGAAVFDTSRGVVTAGGTGNNLTLEGNVFTGFHTGAYFNPGASDATVSGNVFLMNQVGISNDDPDNFDVAGNTFDGNLFEQLGVAVPDTVEDLSTQIASSNVFANTGATPLVSVYPAAGAAQEIIGTTFADTFHGTGNDETFMGLGGDDVIVGAGGNDVLDGGLGADSMTGGEGDDTYTVDDAGDVVVELAGEGTDSVETSLANYSLGDHVENATSTATTGYVLVGNELDNMLVGSDAGGRLKGAQGEDTLIGGDGEDTLVGGANADTMDGGEGDDRYDVANKDVVNDTGTSGGDLIVAKKINLDLDDYGGIELGTLLGSDNLNIAGTADADTLRGNDGENIVDGEGGGDVLFGGLGNDFFDYDDVSESTSADVDLIRDFEQAVDLSGGDIIDLFDIDARDGGPNNAFSFIGSAAFSSSEGELRFHQTGNKTIIQGDTDGDGSADLEIQLLGVYDLTDADFVL